ncbi:MarR family transcriptional regulator [Streptomyces tricolor]|nr:MarR family transcriptional regulator [Streptomyces tricolor]
MPVSERLGSDIKRAEQALNATKTAVLKPAGLTIAQYGALLYCAAKPGISAAALARLCGVTPPTMNTVLKNLQERDLIVRTPHEWHKNVLETRLTDAGRAVLADADDRASTRRAGPGRRVHRRGAGRADRPARPLCQGAGGTAPGRPVTWYGAGSVTQPAASTRRESRSTARKAKGRSKATRTTVVS